MGFSSDRELNDTLYEQFARICKALASARRFELLDLLSNGEHSVEQLAQETGMTIANTSQHLQQLRSSRLVQIRRKGVEIIYRLADPTVSSLVQAVQNLAEAQLAELDRIVDELIAERKDIPIISMDTLEAQLPAEQIQLLDVRPGSEFAHTHIPGAISMPLSTLQDQYQNLDVQKPIVVYCRGYYSRLSDKAVQFLLELGYPASRMEKGLAEWKAQGKPLASSN